MGDLGSLISEMWAALAARDPLDQLSIGVGLVLPIAGATGTLTWLVVRRLFRNEVDTLERELKAVNDRLAIRTEERDEALLRARKLEATITEEIPREWLAAYEKERDAGNDNRAIETLRDGFERVEPDLRKAVMELAWDQVTRGDADRPHHFSEAWRLSEIGKALSEGNDVAELRDSLREIDAEIAERDGRYDPNDPKWDVFEQSKALTDPAAALATATQLCERARLSIRDGRYREAERVARHAEAISSRAKGPEALLPLAARSYQWATPAPCSAPGRMTTTPSGRTRAWAAGPHPRSPRKQVQGMPSTSLPSHQQQDINLRPSSTNSRRKVCVRSAPTLHRFSRCRC